jgi:hypothetical protein
MTPEEERIRSYLVGQANKLALPDLIAKVRVDTTPLQAAGEAVPAARFQDRPGDGEWSAAEVWTHILEMNESGARMITGAIERGENPGRIRDAISGEVRAGLKSSGDYWTRYLETREALLERVSKANGDEHLDVKISHPQFGDFSWREWLLFMRVHDLDHMRQLQAIAAAFEGVPS